MFHNPCAGDGDEGGEGGGVFAECDGDGDAGVLGGGAGGQAHDVGVGPRLVGAGGAAGAGGGGGGAAGGGRGGPLGDAAGPGVGMVLAEAAGVGGDLHAEAQGREVAGEAAPAVRAEAPDAAVAAQETGPAAAAAAELGAGPVVAAVVRPRGGAADRAALRAGLAAFVEIPVGGAVVRGAERAPGPGRQDGPVARAVLRVVEAQAVGEGRGGGHAERAGRAGRERGGDPGRRAAGGGREAGDGPVRGPVRPRELPLEAARGAGRERLRLQSGPLCRILGDVDVTHVLRRFPAFGVEELTFRAEVLALAFRDLLYLLFDIMKFFSKIMIRKSTSRGIFWSKPSRG